jgi:hypothetical protein
VKHNERSEVTVTMLRNDKSIGHLEARGGNKPGWIGFGSDMSGQFDFLKEIGSDWVGSDQFIYCVFLDL